MGNKPKTETEPKKPAPKTKVAKDLAPKKADATLGGRKLAFPTETV